MKPQDILVALKLLVSGWPGSYAQLGKQLGLSASESHAAIRRARRSGLLPPSGVCPNRTALAEFLIHGLRYAFPAEIGGGTRGMPTGYAARPLREEMAAPDDPAAPVWPDPDGECRGQELTPLCRSVPKAARNDAALYEWLVLADALRAGRARERELAAKIVRERLGYHGE